MLCEKLWHTREPSQGVSPLHPFWQGLQGWMPPFNRVDALCYDLGKLALLQPKCVMRSLYVTCVGVPAGTLFLYRRWCLDRVLCLSLLTLRVIGMFLFAAAGLVLGHYLAQSIYGTSPDGTTMGFNELVLPLSIVSALIGFLITPYITIYPFRWLRTRLRVMPALDLVAATIGLACRFASGCAPHFPVE